MTKRKKAKLEKIKQNVLDKEKRHDILVKEQKEFAQAYRNMEEGDILYNCYSIEEIQTGIVIYNNLILVESDHHMIGSEYKIQTEGLSILRPVDKIEDTGVHIRFLNKNYRVIAGV